MKGIGKISLVLILAFSSISIFAQFDTEEYDSLENQILYNKQRTFGVVAHNLGLGANYRKGKRVSYFSTIMWEIEFVSMKAYNQVKLLNPYYGNSKRFVYGKLNSAFFLRGGVIWKKLLNRKPYWGGVELRFIYGGGASLGMGKPYYYYIIYPNPDQITGYLETERFDPSKHSVTDIYGRAPFTTGLGEINLHPGLYGRVGLNFEFGKRSTRINALEVGAVVDVTPAGFSIMASTSSIERVFFPTIYLSYSFGKRFNKY